jgi:RNase P subunit RPR2
MPLNQIQSQKVKAWLQGAGKTLTCAVCGKPAAQWGGAERVDLQTAAGTLGVSFVVLTCSCGYSVFIKTAQAGF